MAKYETFILEDISELKDGEEQELQIRNAETYEVRVVRAVVSSSPEKLQGSDELRVRWQRGQPIAEPWAIKIVEELGSVVDQLGIK